MLVIRPQADNEITETALWYEAQRPGLGSDFLEAVHAAAGRAREAPAQYPRVHGDMRRVLLQRFPYMLIFEELGDEVVVLACIHGHREPDVWQSRG